MYKLTSNKKCDSIVLNGMIVREESSMQSS
jgi:hypothetical protein